jgi:hypothetical protein
MKINWNIYVREKKINPEWECYDFWLMRYEGRRLLIKFAFEKKKHFVF